MTTDQFVELVECGSHAFHDFHGVARRSDGTIG